MLKNAFKIIMFSQKLRISFFYYLYKLKFIIWVLFISIDAYFNIINILDDDFILDYTSVFGLTMSDALILSDLTAFPTIYILVQFLNFTFYLANYHEYFYLFFHICIFLTLKPKKKINEEF